VLPEWLPSYIIKKTANHFFVFSSLFFSPDLLLPRFARTALPLPLKSAYSYLLALISGVPQSSRRAPAPFMLLPCLPSGRLGSVTINLTSSRVLAQSLLAVALPSLTNQFYGLPLPWTRHTMPLLPGPCPFRVTFDYPPNFPYYGDIFLIRHSSGCLLRVRRSCLDGSSDRQYRSSFRGLGGGGGGRCFLFRPLNHFPLILI